MTSILHLTPFSLLNGTIMVALSILSALRHSLEDISMDNDFHLAPNIL